jgi:hypothetical protein
MTSEQLFEEIYRRLVERGDGSTQLKLVQYRDQLYRELNGRLEKILADAQQPLRAAGQEAGREQVEGGEGRAGLPADQVQPTTPIP